jgi:hypothetical protein
MKIGIITFHWATNYGAILQCYALQTYLEDMGHDVYIINYRPKNYKKTLLKCFFTPRVWSYSSNVKAYIKEQKLEKFRKKYLNETKLYESLEELQSNPPKLDVYVCGSDQIWNPSFTMFGEGKPTPAYFLNFGKDGIKRIAYAVSFGVEVYPEAPSTIARNYVPYFDAISVRENTGLNIVTQLGFTKPIKLSDPTILLDKFKYAFNASNINHATSIKKSAFFYVLRNEDNGIKKIKEHLKVNYRLNTTEGLFNQNSIEEWVRGIQSASIVVTNSYHGMIFSIIFHVPFIVVLAKGAASGMNDRFITLLGHLKLEHRAIEDFNKDEFNKLANEQFNWESIDSKLAEIKKDSNMFFNKILK